MGVCVGDRYVEATGVCVEVMGMCEGDGCVCVCDRYAEVMGVWV